MTRALPIDPATLTRLAEEHGTPLYVYDAATIRARVAQLSAFDVVRYAQKANSNLALLELVRNLHVDVDTVSAGEIWRALIAGFDLDRIAYTADLFDAETLMAIGGLDIRVNCGSLDMLPALARAREPRSPQPVAQSLRWPRFWPLDDPLRQRIESKLAQRIGAEADARSRRRDVTLRLNPGFGHGHDPRVSTGGTASKHGIWHEDLPRALELCAQLGLRVAGLHVHVGSGSDLEHLTRSAGVLEACARAVGPTLRALSAGGGLPVPYRDQDAPFDVRAHFEAWDAARQRASEIAGRRLALEVEPGRFLVAESGVLLARVLGTKQNGATHFTLLDAGFHSLVRPALYGAFHRIVVLNPSKDLRPTVVAGPLCESGDVFTVDGSGAPEERSLPRLAAGDLVAICDAGAYGMSMASRYNSQPLPAEVLVDGGSTRLIRTREGVNDLLQHELDV